MNDTPGWASPGSAPEGPEGQESAPPSDQQGGRPSDTGAQWSQKQPPAGQWTAPTRQSPGQAPPPPPPGPGAPGPTGWNAPTTHPGGYGGAPGGWGTGWGGPPPAAKPGIIPLRPLGVGEILDGAVSTMRTHWRTVLGISLAVAVVVEIITVLVQGLLLDSADTDAIGDPDASFDEVSRALGDSMTASSVVYAVSLIGTVIATALLTTVVSRAILGKSVTPGEAWRDALPRVPRLFGLILLMLLLVVGIVVVGALPGILVAAGGGATAAGVGLAVVGVFAGLAVAIWLGVRFSLAPPALMLEKQGVKQALSRSVKLVRGSWWRVFGIQLLGTIISNILAMIVIVPFALIGAAFGEGGIDGFVTNSGVSYGWTYLIISGIGAVIGYMITFPITAGVSVLLYVDQRIRREALDLELARAAGLQDYGTTGTTPGS